MTRWQISSSKKEEARTQITHYGETEIKLGKVSSMHNPKDFCDCLISAINIAMTYRDDVDRLSNEQKISSVISNERHSKATPEELARKWSIRIQTAKDTV
jgi:hypothetical protein